MESMQSWIVLRESCCGFDFNFLEQVGAVRYKNSYKFRKNYTELSLSNGRCKSSLQINDNIIIHIQKGKKEITTVREFYSDRLVTTFTADQKVVAKKYYKAADRGEIIAMMNH
jgi:hypothetical protein